MTLTNMLTSLRARCPEMRATVFNMIVATYIMAAFNLGFWHRLSDIFNGSPFNVALFGLAVWMLTLFTLSLFSLPGLHRPAAAVMILLAAAASWYQTKLGILIDTVMIENVMETTVTESRALITTGYVLHMVLTGVIPALLLFVPRIRYPRFRHVLWQLPLTSATCFALTFGLLYIDLKANAAAIREHRDLMVSYQPGGTLAAMVSYATMEAKVHDRVVQPLGTDAVKGPALDAAKKPVLLVIFAGETARAQNFGIDGYARDTTPRLRGLDIVNFTQTTSCGTATAVSLPCMFSNLTRAQYSHEAFRGTENLVDVLPHAGVKTLWWDNNTGDQHIAPRIVSQRIEPTSDPVACASGECTDQVLLDVLDRTLADITEDTVLVLHMIGSHGPSYYLRYPEDQAVFTPDCRTADLVQCSAEEVVNAYDNTIHYTDHILAEAIGRLDRQDRVTAAMIYISDHGESLGENGLYLHAAPYFMAPDTQTRVPFVMWLSDRFRDAMGLDQECLKAKADQPVSHDNLFHTVLGLMDIETSVLDEGLDLSAECRSDMSLAGVAEGPRL